MKLGDVLYYGACIAIILTCIVLMLRTS